jgi:hypothetical protein
MSPSEAFIALSAALNEQYRARAGFCAAEDRVAEARAAYIAAVRAEALSPPPPQEDR